MNQASIKAALRAAIQQLDSAGTDAPTLTARLLLGTVLGRSKEWLTAHDDEQLDDTSSARFAALLKRVVAHEPLAYVLGHREFYGLDLQVDARVLIPRPETEMLVELTLAALQADGQLKAEDREQWAVDHADVGTGSGAVPIAVAAHTPQARLLASDVSADALEVARSNARRHGVAERIRFVQSDLLAAVEGLPRVLTANLPYVTRAEIDGLPPEIQDHEPRVALDGGEDGLDLVRRLLGEIAARLPAAPWLRAAFFEIGASQGAAAFAAAHAAFPGARAEILRDLGSRDRVLALRFDSA